MVAIADLVHQTSTTTGTGNFTVAAATGGKQTFSGAFGTGGSSVFFYMIMSQSSAEYEWGLGHMSSSTVLVRDVVLGGSNGTSAVSFSAGTKDIVCDIPAVYQARVINMREVLIANRTYYVRTDGSDSNTGLVNNSGGAFLTIQKAIDTVAALDISIYDVIIQVAAGTYAGANVLKTLTGAGLVTIQGDDTTPSNCLISTSGNVCFTTNGVIGRWKTSGFKSVASVRNFIVEGPATTLTLGAWDFGASSDEHIRVAFGAVLNLTANYTISGGAQRHWSVFGPGSTICPPTGNPAFVVTLTGTPAFSANFAQAIECGFIRVAGISFSGSATGQRYNVTNLGFINSGGVTLPGNSAGAGTNPGTSPYGLYI